MEKKFTDEELQQEKSFEEFRKAYYNAEKGYSDWFANGGCGDENEENTLYQMRDIINLIQRQKAEIERLKDEFKTDYRNSWKNKFFSALEENRELQKQVDELSNRRIEPI